MATGPISFVGGVGGVGPQRIGSGKSIPSAITRYFRHNLGTTDYYSHASATVDRIVMTVNPNAGNGNTGLPTGAPAVTDNVLQTIDFAYSGTISELCRNGSSYFSGIMANVKYYFGGVQIHGYDIKSNSNDIPDTIGSNDAAVVNPSVDDWQVYTQQSTGEWLGNTDQWGKTNLASDWIAAGVTLSNVVNGVSAVSNDGSSDRAERTIVGSDIESGRSYRFTVNAARGNQGSLQVIQQFTFATIAPVNITTQAMSPYTFDLLATADTGLVRVYTAGSTGGATGDEVIIGDITAYEVLNVA